MPNSNVNKIFETFSKSNPSPSTELNYTNNYTLLVAVVLSARNTDKGVNKATESLFKEIDSPQKMLKLGEEKLKEYIKTIGLFNSKAKNIIALSEILVSKYNSHIPDNLENLSALPGVGKKTANVILNIAFGIPTIPVDTHVIRLSSRLDLSKSNNTDKIELDLKKNIPTKWQLNAHHWLVLHGRYVCKAAKPKCSECLISKYCNYENKTA